MRTFVHYIPIATSVFSLAFSYILLRRWRAKGGLHLFWWGIGALMYGVGTVTESITTLFGWHEPVFRTWYISGALLGGAPLAQGTVYLLLPRRTANWLTVALLTTVAVASTFVLLTPIDYSVVENHRLTGAVMEWSWVRGFSPFINLYAAAFLIGGAVLSAVRYRRVPGMENRVIGNILIAVGALLPGIGGTFTRFGHVEVLYVTEFIGILLIYAGFRYNVATGPSPFGRKSVEGVITPSEAGPATTRPLQEP